VSLLVDAIMELAAAVKSESTGIVHRKIGDIWNQIQSDVRNEIRKMGNEMRNETQIQHDQTPLEKAMRLVNTEFNRTPSRYRLRVIKLLSEENGAMVFNCITPTERVYFAVDLVGRVMSEDEEKDVSHILFGSRQDRKLKRRGRRR